MYLGDFHREQAWKRWMCTTDDEIRDRQQELMDLMNRIASSATTADYEEAVKVLQSTDIWVASQLLQDWFSKEWLSQYEVSEHSRALSTMMRCRSLGILLPCVYWILLRIESHLQNTSCCAKSFYFVPKLKVFDLNCIGCLKWFDSVFVMLNFLHRFVNFSNALR